MTADWAAAGSEDLEIRVRLKRGWFGNTLADSIRVYAPLSAVPQSTDNQKSG